MKKIPDAIKVRLLMLVGCLVIVLFVGILWSIMIQDAISLYLTLILALFGGIKAMSIYRDARDHRYEICEGLLVSRKLIPGRKLEELQMLCDDDVIEVLLAGRHGFVVGQQYRIYYQQNGDASSHLPSPFKQGCVLLGYEKTAESACK